MIRWCQPMGQDPPKKKMVVSCCAISCKERFAKGSDITFHSFPNNSDVKKQWLVAIRRDGFAPTKYTKVCSKHFEPNCFNKEGFGGHWLRKGAVPTIFNFPQHLPKKREGRRALKRVAAPEPVECTTQPQPDPAESEDCRPSQPQPDPAESEDCRPSQPQPDPAESEECRPSQPQPDPAESEDCRPSQPHPSSSAISAGDELPVASDSHAPPRPKKKCYRYVGDFTMEDMSSPTKAQNCLLLAHKEHLQSRLQIRNLLQKNKRLEKRVAVLKEVLKTRHKKSLVSDADSDLLENAFRGPAAERLKRATFLKTATGRKYTPELRAFALTLRLYSGKAYNYMRKRFKSTLPHPNTLTKWYSVVDGSPGLTPPI